jgi:hypothetical protein
MSSNIPVLFEELFEPFANIQESIEKLLALIEGWWYLNTTPLGDTVFNAVLITIPDEGRFIRFPVRVQDFPQGIKTGTGVDAVDIPWRLLEDGKTVELLDTSQLVKIGDYVILYFPEIKLVSDNAYRFYGRLLAPDYYSPDSEGYLDFLEKALRFFVLGPTVEAAKGLSDGTGDYITHPNWWDVLLLPPDLVELHVYPKIGVDTYDGETVIPTVSPLENYDFLFRWSQDFGEAYFDDPDRPLYFGYFGDGKLDYVFDGKTPAYMLIDSYLKHHLVIFDISSIATPDKEELEKRLKVINEGRPAGSRLLLYYKSDFSRADTQDFWELEITYDLRFDGEGRFNSTYPEPLAFDVPGNYFDDKRPPLDLRTERPEVVFDDQGKPCLFDLGLFMSLADSQQAYYTPSRFALYFNAGDAVFDSTSAVFSGEYPEGGLYGGLGLPVFDQGSALKYDYCMAFDTDKKPFCDLGVETFPLQYFEDEAYFRFNSQLVIGIEKQPEGETILTAGG